MSEQAFDLKTVVGPAVHRDPEDRRAIEVDGLTGDELEEIPAESIPAKRSDFEGLCAQGRGLASYKCHDRNRARQSAFPRCHVSASSPSSSLQSRRTGGQR